MKKLIAILLGAGMIGYPAATWYFGKQAEASSQQLADAIGQSIPYVAVASNDYQKGFFNSTQTIKLRPAFPGMTTKPGDEIVIQNVIDHGPLPGFAGVGAARIKHNIIWPESAKAQIAKIWGDKPPLTATTQMNITGGGSTTFASPAINTQQEGATVAFQGFDGKMSFSSGFGSIDYSASSAGMSVTGDKKEQFKVGKIDMNGTQTKLAGTEKIYVGKQQFTIDGVTAAQDGQPALSFKKATYTAESDSKEANFLNANGKFVASGVMYDKADIGEAEYVFSMQKIHAPSLEGMAKVMQTEMQKLASAPQPGAGQQQGALEAAQQMNTVAITNALKQYLPEMSKHAPVFSLDKFRVGNAKDFGALTATIRLLPITGAEIDTPMLLLPKLDATMNIELSESAVALLAGGAAAKMGAAPDMDPKQMTPQMKAQMDAQTKQMIDAQLGGLVQQGYVTRSAGKVTAQIVMKGGKLTVNGKPVGGGMLPSQ
jgi:uncharacterized protein YdgA (DUF945 family)